MSLVLISDGFTRTAKTEPTEHRYPVVDFTYRPALAAAISEYRHGCAQGPKQEEKATCKLLFDHLKGWDVVDEKGDGSPFTVEVLAKVPEQIRSQMIAIICGWTMQEQAEQAKNS
jgi:hypothetical protein